MDEKEDADFAWASLEEKENLEDALEEKDRLLSKQLEEGDHLDPKKQLNKQLTEIPEFFADIEFPKNCATYLQKIADCKRKLTSETGNPRAWNEEIQKNTDMIGLMETTWKNKDNYDPLVLSTIKYYLKQILNDTDDFEFDSKTKMEIWIKSKTTSINPDTDELKVTNINSFVSKAKSFVIPNFQFQDSKEEIEEEDKIKGTSNLSILSKGLLRSLKENGELNLHNLLKIILLQINFNLNVNDGNLSIYDVTFQAVNSFLEDLEAQHDKMIKIVSLEQKRIDGFILEVAYEVVDKKNQDKDKLQAFLDITNMLDLNEDCIKFINKYAPQHAEWSELKSAIDSLREGREKMNEVIGENLIKIVGDDGNEMENMPSQQDKYTIDSSNYDSGDMEKRKILNQFGLIDFYPSKITLADIRRKRIDKVVSVSDLPWFLLQRILLLDCRVRNKLRVSTKEQDRSNENEENGENWLDQLLKGTSETKDVCFNPMDVVAAVFLCSSNFLKQILAQKLCMTKLSIPFLLTDVHDTLILQKWSLRDIILNGRNGEISASKSKIPIVTFVRTGEISRSKSKLLNELLSNQHHDTFFHEDCKNGNVKSILSRGAVDAAWYIHSTKAKCSCSKKICQCHFNDTMMFMNLHGKCKEFENQVNFLCRISNMMVIMVDLDKMEDLSLVESIRMIAKISKKILLIVTRKQGSEKTNSIIRQVVVESGFDKTVADKKFDLLLDFNDSETQNKNLDIFKGEIIAKVNNLIVENKSLLETELTKHQSLFISDEDNEEFQTGKNRAEDIHRIITKFKIHEAKAKLLPLQGDLWKEWAEIKKEENRISKMHENHSIDDYKAILYQKRQDLRKEQIEICGKNDILIKQFVQNLRELDGNTRHYFMHFLQMNLDELSRRELPVIERKYSELWSEIENKDKAMSDEISSLKERLGNLEKQLEESSFGLEHLLREMGQLFEAVTDLKEKVSDKVSSSIGKLPKIMAELLLGGQPVEIMDGNAAHVPLKWIQAVFKEVRSIIGEKKIFVLFVLGIQSSGKSTLLNTMFGLQFAVKAGRCTRGVFAQLVHLPENTKDLGYNYIMVVDTEGLRAPVLGLEKHQHDNELATLAIGIADLAIINIKGENHAEMQDVLQIVVHAFVRMQIVNKSLKLKASCFFIHQNVGAHNAEAEIKREKTKLMNKLNEMTKAAAYSENVTDVEKFTDVINFDVHESVKYFTNLWLGELPMAPVNPGYSEKVEDVKDILYDIMSRRSLRSTIEQISIRIGDLWRGILEDDFVFNFRNSLEMKAFQSLELEKNNLSFNVKNDVVDWFNDNALGKLRATTTAANLENVKTELESSLKYKVQEEYEKALSALKTFFAKSEEAETLEQWKFSSENNLKELKNSIITSTLKSIKSETDIRIMKINQNKQFSEWNEQISEKTTGVAINLRGRNLSEAELNSEFEIVWTKMVAKQPSRVPQNDAKDVKSEVRSSLMHALSGSTPLLNEHLKTKKLDSAVENLLDFEIKDEYFAAKTTFKMPEYFKRYDYKFITVVHAITQNIIRDEIQPFLKKIEDQNFSKHHAETILKMVGYRFRHVNEDDKRGFVLTKEYKVSLFVHVCRFLIPRFKRMQEAYNRKIDPKIEENRFKERLLIKFKNIYEKRATEKIVADQLCHVLENRVKEKLILDLPQKLVAEVWTNHPFMGSAGLLKKQVMKELLELDSFEMYEYFIDDNQACITEWLRKYTKEHLFDEKLPSRYGEIAKIHLGQILMKIEKAINFLTDIEYNDQKNYWKQFIKELQKIIPVPSEEFEDNFKDDVNIDFKNLSDIMFENLSTIRDDLEKQYKEANFLPSELESKIVDGLSEYCIGCRPLCHRALSKRSWWL